MIESVRFYLPLWGIVFPVLALASHYLFDQDALRSWTFLMIGSLAYLAVKALVSR